MTREQLIKYWNPARSAVFGRIVEEEDRYQATLQLASLLGVYYPRPEYWHEVPFTQELKRSLELIVSSNGHTIIKMLEVKRGHSVEKGTSATVSHDADC